jgi:hypothetical protein
VLLLKECAACSHKFADTPNPIIILLFLQHLYTFSSIFPMKLKKNVIHVKKGKTLNYNFQLSEIRMQDSMTCKILWELAQLWKSETKIS